MLHFVNARSRSQFERDVAIERRRRDGTSDRQAILSLLASFDVEGYLLDAGLTPDDLARGRRRLLSPPSPGGRPAG